MSATPATRSASRVASRAVLRTEASLFAREPGAFFWIVAFPTLLFCVLALIPSFRESDPELGGQSVADLYVQVAALLAMITGSVQSMPAILSGYRERGILRRMRTTPVRPHSLLFAQAMMHGLGMALGVVLVIVVARLTIGTPLPQNLVAYVGSGLLALAAALAIGAVITALSATSRATTITGTIVFFPAMFTAGVWLPVQAMPDLMQRIVVATPLGASAEALNDAAVGQWPDVVDLLVMAGWTGALAVVAVRWFRWE